MSTNTKKVHLAGYTFLPSVTADDNGKLLRVNERGEWTVVTEDLLNYYLKSETYTKEEVQSLIGAVKTISILPVEELPEVGETNIIYLVPATTDEYRNVFSEYIYVNDAWECIGTTAVDISNYVKNTDYATDTKAGVIKPVQFGGIHVDANGNAIVATANETEIAEKSSAYKPIGPNLLDFAIKQGLAYSKLKGDVTNAWTVEEKANAKELLGIGGTFTELSEDALLPYLEPGWYSVKSDMTLRMHPTQTYGEMRFRKGDSFFVESKHDNDRVTNTDVKFAYSFYQINVNNDVIGGPRLRWVGVLYSLDDPSYVLNTYPGEVRLTDIVTTKTAQTISAEKIFEVPPVMPNGVQIGDDFLDAETAARLMAGEIIVQFFYLDDDTELTSEDWDLLVEGPFVIIRYNNNFYYKGVGVNTGMGYYTQTYSSIWDNPADDEMYIKAIRLILDYADWSYRFEHYEYKVSGSGGGGSSSRLYTHTLSMTGSTAHEGVEIAGSVVFLSTSADPITDFNNTRIKNLSVMRINVTAYTTDGAYALEDIYFNGDGSANCTWNFGDGATTAYPVPVHDDLVVEVK